MANQELIDYIKKAKESGQTNEQIKSALITNGWQASDIEETLKNLNFAKPKKFKKILLIITIIVAALILAGINYIVYYLNPKIQLEGKKQEASNQAQKENENKTMMGWETYQNKKYGYSFKYPNDFHVLDKEFIESVQNSNSFSQEDKNLFKEFEQSGMVTEGNVMIGGKSSEKATYFDIGYSFSVLSKEDLGGSFDKYLETRRTNQTKWLDYGVEWKEQNIFVGVEKIPGIEFSTNYQSKMIKDKLSSAVIYSTLFQYDTDYFEIGANLMDRNDVNAEEYIKNYHNIIDSVSFSK